MKRIFLTILISYSILFASSKSDPIIYMPKGTVFTLNQELEVPANKNFVLLGYNTLFEVFNRLHQPMNDIHGKKYHTYNNFFLYWMESVGRTYKDCIERHRKYYSYGGNSASNSNTIINQGSGNTNIIYNNQNSNKISGTYIGNNTCIKPEHTFASLLIDKYESDGGGIFRDGYEFKVKKVSHYKDGYFHIVNIYFDHKIAKGIRVVSTTNPENIKIYNLEQTIKKSDSFWSGLGNAFIGLNNIGGDYFKISLPSKKYFE